MATALCGAGPANAQDANKGLELVSRAAKAYDAGSYAEAAAAIDEAFKAGLSKELAARAILLRAQVNERNGAFARALQDYSNALWMDTLPAKERKVAADGKQRVIAAMGLNTPSQQPPQQASLSAGGPSIQGQPAGSSSSGGVFGMFNGLFGSSNPPAPPPARPAEPQPNWQTSTSASGPITHGQPHHTAAAEPAETSVPSRPAEKVAHHHPAPIAASIQPVSTREPSSPAEGFLIVFGTASNERAGHTEAKQIKAQVADILVARNLDLQPNVNGGVLIVAGPYKSKSAALALCSAMKQRGVRCQVTP